MKTNVLLALLTIAAVTFMMGCNGGAMGEAQEISGWPLKIGGAYKSEISSFTGTTTFKVSEGKLSGGYELTAGGEKVTGTLSNFAATGKNKLKCRWKDMNGVGDFTMTFSDDLSSFTGKWDNDADGAGGPWNGKK
ncbi:MAG: hypothetical protein ISS69_08985 [Phycisphaerae bacterium]|nr:hypothetical protein [Phycisphaerae bacterium]